MNKATFSETTPTRKKRKKTPTKGTSSNFIGRDSKPYNCWMNKATFSETTPTRKKRKKTPNKRDFIQLHPKRLQTLMLLDELSSSSKP